MRTNQIPLAVHVKLQCLAVLAFASSVLAQSETPAEIVARHVRMTGQPCEKVVSAEHDKTDSRPNGQVWILTCSNATYRVHLVPDLAGKVEVITPKK
jgi:hypothetical protein